MNIVLERTSEGQITQAILYVTASELLIIDSALVDLQNNKERDIQDRAKAEYMKMEIGKMIWGTKGTI